MNLLGIVNNIALLVALAALYQVVMSRLPLSSVSGQVIFGLLFGLVTILGMMTPVSPVPGIIFDGRSVILAVAGLIGGPLVALISAVLAAGYRLWLGGGGAMVGLAVIIMSAGLGTGAHYLRRRRGGSLDALHLLGFGVLVHIVMLGIFLYLPDGIGLQVVEQAGAIILLVYPLATMLISLLFQDYEVQEKTRNHLQRLAYFDRVTGLPNRALLFDRLSQQASADYLERGDGALLLLNIDRFKNLNDARGHTTGDALLHAIGPRLQPLLRDGDTLAHLGADEFAVSLYRPNQHAVAFRLYLSDLAAQIHQAVGQPLHIGTDEVSVSISLGVASFTPGGNDRASDIVRRADTALHQAKRRGGNQTVFFENTMAKAAEHQYHTERELRRAISAGELRLFLQSQVDNSGRIVGAEALVRWQHPQHGLLEPEAFISIAEETDLIVAIDAWVLRETCTLLALPELAALGVRLSVNISPRHLHQPSFFTWFNDTLNASAANPAQLTLEITEGILLENVNDVIEKMTALSALGVRLSVDDFGTGYSSLTYLKRLPIHEIKIDRSFVQDAPTDPSDATLVDTILAVAEHMRLDVVAEGVETQLHADFLNSRGAILRQGYFYGHPEPFEVWLRRLPPPCDTSATSN